MALRVLLHFRFLFVISPPRPRCVNSLASYYCFCCFLKFLVLPIFFPSTSLAFLYYFRFLHFLLGFKNEMLSISILTSSFFLSSVFSLSFFSITISISYIFLPISSFFLLFVYLYIFHPVKNENELECQSGTREVLGVGMNQTQGTHLAAAAAYEVLVKRVCLSECP